MQPSVELIPIRNALFPLIRHVMRDNSIEITENSTWYSLNIDSLDLFELIIQCEAEFQISIPDQYVARVYKVEDLIDVIVSLLKKEL